MKYSFSLIFQQNGILLFVTDFVCFVIWSSFTTQVCDLIKVGHFLYNHLGWMTLLLELPERLIFRILRTCIRYTWFRWRFYDPYHFRVVSSHGNWPMMYQDNKACILYNKTNDVGWPSSILASQINSIRFRRSIRFRINICLELLYLSVGMCAINIFAGRVHMLY